MIVAARNAASTLAETLESIKVQTYSSWEVVLVDDGSVDETAGVADAFDGPIRIHRHEQPRGPSAARNAGAAASEAEFVAMLDADDQWKPRYLERVMSVFDDARAAAPRRVGLVTTDALLLGPDGLLAETYHSRVGLRVPITLDTLLESNVLAPVAVCPRTVFLETGGYNPALRYAEDYDLWLRILERGYEAIALDEPLACYRFRPESASSATACLAEGTMKAYELALQRGRLTPRQRRIARRQRRLHRAVAARARAARARVDGDLSMWLRVRALVFASTAAAEHPERWAGWLRRGLRDPAGPSRHK